MEAIASKQESAESVVVDSSGHFFSFPTSSKATRFLGISALVVLVPYLLFALNLSPAHNEQAEHVRLLYVHVPSVIIAYLCFLGTLFGSVVYLWKKSTFWDLFAGSVAEIGVLFCGLVLVTGSIWGKPTWGAYWEWEPRLTSTAVLFVMYLGYLAVRRMDLSPDARAHRAAILGIVSFLNTIIVHYSVKWWRGLHQGETFKASPLIDGFRMFSFFLGVVFFLLVASWLVIHRFRVSWLENVRFGLDLEEAIAKRRKDDG